MTPFTFLDCTLRDGGYYNDWDFDQELISDYLTAMASSNVDAVELGFRSRKRGRFLGACAYTSDSFLNSLDLPSSLKIGVMVNGSELVGEEPQEQVLQHLFPRTAQDSPVDFVRIACHVHEVAQALPAAKWLKDRGYTVGFNLMQVADRTESEIRELARHASQYPVDVLYFADSMGSLNPVDVSRIVDWLRHEWTGPLGIHTHDNMGLALTNTLQALDKGVTWVDSTVTGMGRGPGNALTEQLAIEVAQRRGVSLNLVPLMTLIRQHFKPLQDQFKWGTNPYYYLAGKYGIHPTYIQSMLSDFRYSEEDVLSVIDHLHQEGASKFSMAALDDARHFYSAKSPGDWSPASVMKDREVLLLGSGPGASRHKEALERYIATHDPVVLALNTQTPLDPDLIHYRVACHPVRLLADCQAHISLPQPLIVPEAVLPSHVKQALSGKKTLDFGIRIQEGTFAFSNTQATLPTSLVAAYALAIITSGHAKRILLAGFDGYGAEDPRSLEMQELLDCYINTEGALPLTAVTPSRYGLHTESIYAL